MLSAERSRPANRGRFLFSVTCGSAAGGIVVTQMIKYRSEQEIFDVVGAFENATITRDAWKHAQHLTVALYYLTCHDIETATGKMRDGIFNLLRAFDVDLSKEMPYHETLTVFWMRTVAEFRSKKVGISLLEQANELIERVDKDYPFRFYSRELLFSDEARIAFVEGDLKLAIQGF